MVYVYIMFDKMLKTTNLGTDGVGHSASASGACYNFRPLQVPCTIMVPSCNISMIWYNFWSLEAAMK
jgi:hypothetical protein